MTFILKPIVPGIVWTISNLSVGLTCVILIFVILKHAVKKVHFFLAFFNTMVAVWGFGAFFIGLAKNSSEAMLAWKIACVGGLISPAVFYHMLNILSGSKRWKGILVFYLFSTLIISILLAELFGLKVVHLYGSLYYLNASSLIWRFLVSIWISIIVYSLFVLFKLFKSSSGAKKTQYRYLTIGFVLGFSAAIWDSLPTIGLYVYPAGNILMSFYCILITYAILQYQLMDIEVIIKKTVIFGGIFASVYAVFAFFALLGQVFFERYVTANRWIAMIPSVVVVTLILRPLENFLVSVTDRFLFQKKYDYKELLKAFSEEVLTVLELDRLVRLTEEKLVQIMKLEYAKVEFEEYFLNADSRRLHADKRRYLRKSALDLRESALKEAALTLPIAMHNQDIGVLLLGKKKSDEEYTKDDLDILNSLAKTLAIAISNARLFDELAKTRAEAAQKDKMATIGTLAAGMAHEIRNPITTIRNFADYLPEKYEDGAFVNKFKELIPREIDRIESVARSLLEFSSAEGAGEKEEFAIDEPIRTVLAIIEPQYRTAEIKINCNYKEKHIIKGNRVQLQDAFFNILNYIFAESQKGSLVSMECSTKEGSLSLSIRNKDLVVGEHIIKDVFEPVSDLHKERRGFGFNLFIAKQLIERNNGTLTISSDKANGSEFRIDLKNGTVPINAK